MSQTRHNCGYTSKENRKTQPNFHCTVCGYELNADINATKNILAVGLTVSACGAAALAAQ
jgi:putative transposase